MKLSIIIVNYKVKDELFACIKSIIQSKPKVSYEIIVVDNDEEKIIESEVKRKYPKVLYIKSPGNIGFGSGNNLGEKYAKGEYLFFLNPDTLIENGTIDYLYNFLKQHRNVGIVAPLLLDNENRPYPLQGTLELTPMRGIVVLSFLNRLFPNNVISKNFWLKEWNKQIIKEVDVVPGTAFVIRRSIFKKLGGFDKRFFLFFEENDLCKRVRSLGYKIIIKPESKIIHLWGKSTSQIKDAKTIFTKSRFNYFQKHYGFIWAVSVEFFLGINKLNLMLSVILIVALFLRLYRLNELMSFIPDQGWFYLSARDMILTGKIPLVGPETSHPWIHHGPLWTYVLAIILWIFNFNPVAPAYFIAVLGVVTVWLFYKVSSEMFTKSIGLIASFLYATSPLIVLNARIPYHTSPIPFFAILLFYSVYKWIKGNVYFFPLITFLIAVLYNHELTTFVFSIPILLLVLYGFWKKKNWATRLLNKKIIFYSVFAFLIPMIPFILYDITHGYKQTIGFLVWVGYRLVKFSLNIPTNSLVEPSYNLAQLIFAPSLAISILILSGSIIFFLYFFTLNLRNKNIHLGTILLFLYLFIPLFGLFLHRVPIEADILLISPFIIMAIAVFFYKIVNFHFLKVPAIIFIAIISFANFFFLTNEYFFGEKSEKRLTISKLTRAADSAIEMADGRAYNLIGQGELSFFPVFTMPYEYLLWWKGHPPKIENVDLKIVVWEKEGEIVVYKEK